TIDGDLVLLSGGTITDDGIATVRGTLTATTDQSNKIITLDELAVTGAFTLAPDGTGAVTIVNAAGLNLAASTMRGTFSGTATTGDISDSGNLAITGAATFITTADDRSIILDQSGSVFTSTVTMQAGNGSNNVFENITFVDSADVKLHSSAASAGDIYINASTDLAVSGNLNITATTGNITQGAAVTVTGTSSFETIDTGADIILGSANALGAAVTLTTAGSGGNVTLDNGTTALIVAQSSVGGDLTLTSGHASGITDSGTVTVGGDFSATTDANNGDINMGTLAVTGTIALTTNDAANNNTGHATVVNATQVNLVASSIDGNLAVTATTGNITQSGTLTITGTSNLVTSANDAKIVLENTNNAFTGALTFTTNDASNTDADVTIDGGTTALIIAASTIDGDLTLTSGATAGITDSGTVTVLGDIYLITNAGNGVIDMGTLAVTGSVDIETHGTGDATLVNATDIDFMISTVGGELTATATTGDITQSGQLDINGTGTTTITASATGANITLFNSSNDFEGVVSTAGYDVKLWTADTMNLGAATVTGDYTVYAGTTITDSGAQIITGDTTLKTHAASSQITLDHASNSFGGSFNTVGGIGYSVNDTSSDGIVVIGRTLVGNVTVTASGPVTQSGALVVGGLTSITATGKNITLTDTSNDFQQAVKLVGANVEIVDTNSIDLGASTVTGIYKVTASGNVIDSGTQEITGVTTIAAGSGNDITLNTSTNNFAAAVKIISGNNIEIIDEDTIDLGDSTVSGAYEITAGGAVTDSGTLEISGITTIEAGSSNNITLNSSTNNFAAAVKITSGNDVAITDEDTIDLGNSTVSGTYAITASAGNITDSGILAITSNSTFTTNGNGAGIKLDAINRFTGTVTVDTTGAGGAAEVHGGNMPLKVIASGGVGTLKLTTTGADITDSGSLVVTGATTIDAGGADITLDHGSSSLQGAVGASGRNVSLTHPTGIDLGASTVTGTYGVTATTGNITDTGALSITGLATLVTSADGGDITINGTGHAFTGNVKVTTNETNSDKDAHATIDGGSTIGLKIERGSEIQGNLTLISGHANTITDEGSSGVVTVDGNLTATTNANNGSITLNDLAVDGTIGVNTHGTGNATLVNDAGLQFASSTVGGNLHATSTT
ncbi:MAG: beta strand repeat-containing protein, partial [Pirellulales bacterium]